MKKSFITLIALSCSLFQIEKVILQIRTCAFKRSGDSPLFTKLIEKMKQDKEQEREAQLQKMLNSENNVNNGNDDEKSKDEPPVKKLKSEETAKDEAKTEKKEGEDEKKDATKDNKPKQLPFNEDKYLRRMDKWCENCRKDIPEPRQAELVMFLHAAKFKVYTSFLMV